MEGDTCDTCDGKCGKFFLVHPSCRDAQKPSQPSHHHVGGWGRSAGVRRNRENV